MKISEFNSLSLNEAVDYYYDIGVNPLPMDSVTKRPLVESWLQYQDERIPPELVEEWKTTDLYNKGKAIGLVLGKLHRTYGGETYYLVGVDLDNQAAIDKITTINGVKKSFEEFTKEGMIVEQHNGTTDRAHLLFLSHREYKKLSTTITSKNSKNVPAIEVRSARDQLIIVTPSLHKDGTKRQIIGNPDQELEFQVFDKFDKYIDTILKEFGISYLESNNGSYNSIGKIPIGDLFKDDIEIHEGNNRHEAILRVMDSLLKRNYGILSLDQIKKLSQERNQIICKPPLNDIEFEKQWKCAIKWIGSKEIGVDNNSNNNNNDKFDEKYPELVGNVYYQINEKPEKYIVAYKQKKQVIEVTTKSVTKKVGGNEIIEIYLIHNKTYFACIPVKIVRHKNPLTFLQLQPTFTISFVDAIGEYHVFNYKPLSTIIQSLKDLGLVLADGSDAALAAMMQAYKQRNLIEDNEDLQYIGFLEVNNRILASNLEIKEPSIEKLSGALDLLVELKTHYENRLDLLTTSIHWGMIAPFNFIVKTNNYFLKLLHFYGFSNSTKTNTGKIILALDGHHEERIYASNFDRVDTQARFADAVSRSTFPVLIDEVPDLNDERKYDRFIINIKALAENQILRTKFLTSKARTAEDFPALCCVILTSNYAPPVRNSGYMRRVITRNFPKEESWDPNDPRTKIFQNFLQVNLPRLKALGDFRNWYVMNHQEIILNKDRPEPLDIGLNILRAAFSAAGKEIPEWIVNERLPENQLEESIEESDVIVRGAFQKLINERIGKALYLWNLGKDKDTQIELPKTITERLIKLSRNNLLEYVKYVPESKYKKIKEGVRISTGILTELYDYGVGKDQLPHLTTLANYMEAEYRKSDGKNIIFADLETLEKYFDPTEEENGDLRRYSQ